MGRRSGGAGERRRLGLRVSGLGLRRRSARPSAPRDGGENHPLLRLLTRRLPASLRRIQLAFDDERALLRCTSRGADRDNCAASRCSARAPRP
jgi:hypothetical protein